MSKTSEIARRRGERDDAVRRSLWLRLARRESWLWLACVLVVALMFLGGEDGDEINLIGIGVLVAVTLTANWVFRSLETPE